MNINKRTIIIVTSTLILGVLVGWLLFGQTSEPKVENHEHTLMAESKNIWTCSMHPQIRRDEPGNCPICGMDLIPLEVDGVEADPMAVSMSPTAMQLAHVQTMMVGSGNAEKTVRLNGKVQADERLLFTQSSHIPGRIEKLSINFTGDLISKGQVIAYIYSPDLVTAQEELLVAKKLSETQPALFKAAQEKLRNWKLTDKQIGQITASNKTMDQFPILANVSGYVTKKMVNLGDYIKQGEPMYEIADLSKVWVLFDVYESDMIWIKKGASVSYSVESIPGKIFKGTVSYIDPIIDPKTRVANARIEVSNTQ
ncbi:MAG: efflux RND transporter periplasmic adaptor subunit, partial [Chryseolinea sp.]